MNKLQRVVFASAVLLCCLTNNIQAQKSININDSQKIPYLKNESAEIISHFEDAENYRRFSYNQELRELTQSNVNDTILLDFFEDKAYKAVIKNVTLRENKEISISAELVDVKFGYCYISISNEGILVSTELPGSDEQFDVTVINGQTYLSQHKISVARKNILECSEPIIPDNISSNNDLTLKSDENGTFQSNNIEEDVVIDVMVVYTQKAKEWADYSSSGIDNVINMAMEKSNTAMANSGTGISFNLVHKYQTDYEETDSSLDLSRLQNDGDGYLDEVHVLRELYKADLIVLIPLVSYTGGVAYRLSNEDGNKAWCSFSLCRVQQAATGYTVVHEMAHNMGCGHHKEQNYQAGPGLYNYSAGWRGTQLGGYTTIMSYESGSYYADNRTYYRIPYFSSPDIQVSGVSIGHADDGNNVLNLKKTKHVTAGYTIPDNQINITIENYSKTYGEAEPELSYSIIGTGPKSGDLILLERQSGENAGTYPIVCKILREDEDVSSEYRILLTNSTFTINPRTLTLKLEDKTAVYTGNHIYTDPVTIEGLIDGDNIEISYSYYYEKKGTYTDYALAVGKYMITAKASGNPNYNEASTTGTFSINYNFDDVVKVKWNNTLMLKVAKITEDGFRVSGCQWYKNGTVILGATNYSYSVGPENTDLLDATALYSVQIKTLDGYINTTESLIRLKSFDIKVYPNPKSIHETIYLEADIDEDALEGAIAEIYNLSGNLIKTVHIREYSTPLDLPANKGTYIIRFKGKDGYSKELKAIVK
ncbi:hypothetical protein GGR21_003741 [Dysgonomonas hofstadii]|uniref:MBG domain-containing protein n=1 Tax=Dysgonomonas hofstadii TaxID=637886 RepID=A0A840CP85_9BACT|nr:M12 family metallo-peptidase [Dysgonomonas hofstadii]MBB4037820.1 hypothetical protein [Dysgonomonas hofstadii]